MKAYVFACAVAACGWIQAADQPGVDPAPGAVTPLQPANGPKLRSSRPTDESQAKTNYEAPRIIIGFEQAGASSAESSQNFFGNFDLTIPTRKDWFRILLDGRLTTVPQQINASLGDFVAGGALQSLQAVHVNQLVRGLEAHGGGEFRVREIGSYSFGEDQTNVFRNYFSFVAAGGFSTPFTPLSTLQVVNVPPAGSNQLDALQKQLGIPSGYKYVGFLTKDRDRFFKEYFGGIRITQVSEPKDKNKVDASFTTGSPLTLDLAYGQDQAITAAASGGPYSSSTSLPRFHTCCR